LIDAHHTEARDNFARQEEEIQQLNDSLKEQRVYFDGRVDALDQKTQKQIDDLNNKLNNFMQVTVTRQEKDEEDLRKLSIHVDAEVSKMHAEFNEFKLEMEEKYEELKADYHSVLIILIVAVFVVGTIVVVILVYFLRKNQTEQQEMNESTPLKPSGRGYQNI
jgi:hypothetical protein